MLRYGATIYQTQDEQHIKNIEKDRIEFKKQEQEQDIFWN